MHARIPIVITSLLLSLSISARSINRYEIIHNKELRTITISVQQGDLKMTIDYSNGCVISMLMVKGKNTLSPEGVLTGVTTKTDAYSSRQTNGSPVVTVKNNRVTIDNIKFGNDDVGIAESWIFNVSDNKIVWNLKRNYSNNIIAEDMVFPKWTFASLTTWKGGIIDNGGVVWCKYLRNVNDTYGVHTGGTVFWNEETGDGLSIQGKALDSSFIAMKYSHSRGGEFSTTHLISKTPLKQRYELNRFIEKKGDVFAAFETGKQASASFTIQYVDYSKEYDRGNLKGLNAIAVRELMNTTARYGVVDNEIIGGNGWLTNWKCLHEPFFSQIALALADSNYTKNLKATLDREKVVAIKEDGRVLSRWHNTPGDEMPGTFNKQTGYYETVWGYTIDSQTGYIINVCELFDLLGDKQWLASHKTTCEKALQWLIRRDSNKNGLFEMMNSNIREKKSSDWIDIVWAGYENAFVNAQMYAALTKWAKCETLLGDTMSATLFNSIARTLKESFNKPIDQGGFWSPEKKQYIYWRDEDQSIHGDNLVTPVNFAAIAFGICDNKDRIKNILEQIERRTTDENLFHWPLCFDSFKREEVHDNNWPFPTYENGDIFPTWGYLGVRAYIQYDKKLALKYIINLLDQYEKDGLSSQRYDRRTQKGLGTDILAGICTGITALYSDIYGIHPRWNRLIIKPNLTESLDGTSFNYSLRNVSYRINLSSALIGVSTSFVSLTSNRDFGISGSKGKLIFYPGEQDTAAITIMWNQKNNKKFHIQQISGSEYLITPRVSGVYQFSIQGKPGEQYSIQNGDVHKELEAEAGNSVVLKQYVKAKTGLRIIVK